MRVLPLASVKDRIVLGQPLPFSVRDNGRMLLLAKGQIIHDDVQLEELFQRGALVEAEELLAAVQPVRREDPATRLARLPAAWESSTEAVRQALSAAPPELMNALHSATDTLMALIDSAPDVALWQIVRQSESDGGHYGVTHSIHAATACHAAAGYLGWDAVSQRRAFQAALTMNLGMLDLQAKLATQVSPLTALQREAIKEHPIRSRVMLEAAGIEDLDWLDAVLMHHELPDGSGYPNGSTDVGELAEMLRFADIYTARLSARANRPAMSAQQAGRELHQMADASPLASALIKAFGIFPPGSLVKLASGELGLVLRNGEKAHHPIVAALTNANGQPRMAPAMRNSSDAAFAVVALLPHQAMPVRLTEERIAGLIAQPG